MFNEWLKMAGSILAVVVLVAVLSEGSTAILPLLIGGGVIYTLFHQAKGFSQADNDRHRGRRTRR